jgi:hypothetical protein
VGARAAGVRCAWGRVGWDGMQGEGSGMGGWEIGVGVGGAGSGICWCLWLVACVGLAWACAYQGAAIQPVGCSRETKRVGSKLLSLPLSSCLVLVASSDHRASGSEATASPCWGASGSCSALSFVGVASTQFSTSFQIFS